MDKIASFLNINRPDEWIAFALCVILGLLIFGMLGYLILLGIDSCFRKEKEWVGYVTAMNFKASHHSTTVSMVGKVMVPQTVWHPDTWSVTITMNGLSDTINVSEQDYVKLHVLDSVEISYTTGRIWKSLYVKSIKL